MNKNLLLTIALLTGAANVSASQEVELTTGGKVVAGVLAVTAFYTTYKIGSWFFGDSVEARTKRKIAEVKHLMTTGSVNLAEILPSGKVICVVNGQVVEGADLLK